MSVFVCVKSIMILVFNPHVLTVKTIPLYDKNMIRHNFGQAKRFGCSGFIFYV